jgi:hypothetical protein
MYQSTTDPSRKFMNSFRGKKFDSYHADPQPGEDNANEHSTPQEAGSSAADVAKAHGPAHTVEFVHDHEGNKHKVTSTHDDGYAHNVEHTSAASAYGDGKALAFEAGGEEQSTSPKKREHQPQEGAESEERSYEQPDLE